MTATNDPICSLSDYLRSLGITDRSIDGIPMWMAVVSVVLIIFTSHFLVATWPAMTAGRSYRSWNLLGYKPFNRLVKRSWFPLLMQSVAIVLFLLVISAGLFGNQKTNIAPVLTWTWWWALLIFLVLGFGQAFCMICPWEGISSLVTSLSLKSRVKRLHYDFKWPKWARNIYPAIALFIVLTWFELGRNITHSPSLTAILALCMVGMAVLMAMFFEKRAFCRHVCLVGRITGIYSLFSPVELRPQSVEVCKDCHTKDCYRGNAVATGCPTNLFPGHLTENTYCTLCTECVRACPHDNIGINLRPAATDLFHKDRFQTDEAALAIVLLALTSFHGLTMTPLWTSANNLLRVETGFGPTMIFSLLMLLMLVAPILLFWAGAKVAERLTLGAGVSAFKIFKAFAYSLIPIALFYHLAHNCMHFFLEGGGLIPLLSDPFGWGWNLFGTATKTYGPLLSLQTIWWLQMFCIVIGHVYGVLIADRVAKRLFHESGMTLRSLIPLLFTMILYSCFSVWLISQPMDMRTSGM
jgi:polyferredoxin